MCGYHRGTTTVAVALKDDPRLRKECDWLLEETIDIEDAGWSTTTTSSARSTLDQATPTLFPLTAHLVVTIYNLLLAWLPNLRGTNFKLPAIVVYPYPFSDVRASTGGGGNGDVVVEPSVVAVNSRQSMRLE